MTELMLRVIDGADRGRVYAGLMPPITIGREEGNSVQLNDDRVSRFHVKIQEDNSKLVLTDLESTNGTKVNNEHIQLRILRFGDIIKVGRSVLVFGSPSQIASHLRGSQHQEHHAQTEDVVAQHDEPSASLDFDLRLSSSDCRSPALNRPRPPDLPERLSPGQAAQLSEVLEYLHVQMRGLISSVDVQSPTEGDGPDRISISADLWQQMLEVQTLLSTYLRAVGDPPSD